MAYDFESGSSQYLSNLNGLTHSSGAVTFAFDFMVESLSGVDVLWATGLDMTNEANRSHLIVLTSGTGGDFRLEIRSNYGTDTGRWMLDETAGGGIDLSFNTWYKACITVQDDDTTYDPVFCIDGVEYTVSGGGVTETLTPSGSNVPTLDTIALGRYVLDELYADCRLAEFAIFDRHLSSGEAIARTKGFGAAFFRPEHYWPLVRGLGDLVGGATLTNNNSATVTAHPDVLYPVGGEIIHPAPAVTARRVFLVS